MTSSGVADIEAQAVVNAAAISTAIRGGFKAAKITELSVMYQHPLTKATLWAVGPAPIQPLGLTGNRCRRNWSDFAKRLVANETFHAFAHLGTDIARLLVGTNHPRSDD